MQVKCPKCSTLLKLASPPASGKVKCPKCSAILKVGGAAAAGAAPATTPKQPSAAPQSASQPVPEQQSPFGGLPAAGPLASDPLAADPLAAGPQAAGAIPTSGSMPGVPQAPAPDAFPASTGAPAGGEFDFGNLPSVAPMAAPGFQQPPGFSAAAAAPAPTASGVAATPQAAPAAKGKRTKAGGEDSSGKAVVIISVAATVVMFLLFAVGGFFVVRSLMSGASVGGPKVSSTGREAPDGFQICEINGVTAFLPEGLEIYPANSELKYRAVATPLGTVFAMGVCEIDGKLEGDALKAKMDRITAGNYQAAGMPAKRNGHQGEVGSITKSKHFAPKANTSAPMMNVEIFQDDGRLIMVGVAQDISRSETYVVGESAEPEKEDTFLESLEIGPKPEKGFFDFLWPG